MLDVGDLFILYSWNHAPCYSRPWDLISHIVIVATIQLVSYSCLHLRNSFLRTYKIRSIWSMVTPFVSGRKKKAQILAINIQQAKKNHVPKPNEAKMYGSALVMINWTALSGY